MGLHFVKEPAHFIYLFIFIYLFYKFIYLFIHLLIQLLNKIYPCTVYVYFRNNI